MHISLTLIFGVLLALAALCTAAAFLIFGAATVFTIIEDATGLTLGGQKATKIIVMTDIHYLSPKLTDNGTFFTSLVTNSDGKTMLVIEELADAFIQQVLDEAPDAVVLSGDMTFNGEYQSHLDFAEKLTALTDAGIAVFALPGNHDLNYSQAASFAGDGYTYVDSITPAQFREVYAAFGYGGEALMAADESSLSYMARLNDTQALLLIDVNSGLTGVMTDEILAFAEAQLLAAKEAGLQVIAVSHQSLMDHNSMLSFGYTIAQAAKLLALYEKYDVLCNLSGHIHMQHIATSENGFADIATGAQSVYANWYGVLEWSGVEVNYYTTAVEMPLFIETSEAANSGCESFAEYSLGFFQSDHSGQFAEALGATYSDAEIAAMSDWATETNTHYFMGRRDLIEPDEEALAALQNSGVFFGTYLATIFEDDAADDTIWTNVVQT